MNTSEEPSPWPQPIGIIGAGAVGSALARALAASDQPPVLVGARDLAHALPPPSGIPLGAPAEVAQTARLIFLTVPDSAIVAVAQSLPWRADQWVVHCAGSQPAELLRDAVAPAYAGAFHPLAAFTRQASLPLLNRDEEGGEYVGQPDRAGQAREGVNPLARKTKPYRAAGEDERQMASVEAGEQNARATEAPPLHRSGEGAGGWGHPVIALDGAPEVVAGLWALAERLGGRPLVVTAAARPAYHLAASLASNALVALVAQAVEIWQTAGLATDLALPALLPLIASTQANLERVGLPQALTGPIARGDITTVARHLAVLGADPSLTEIAASYRALGLRAVSLARALGRVPVGDLAALAALLDALPLPGPQGIEA